jgi:hypothetical protein
VKATLLLFPGLFVTLKDTAWIALFTDMLTQVTILVEVTEFSRVHPLEAVKPDGRLTVALLANPVPLIVIWTLLLPTIA